MTKFPYTTILGRLPQTYPCAPFAEIPAMGILPPRNPHPVIAGGPYVGAGGENVGSGDAYETVNASRYRLPDVPHSAAAHARVYRLLTPERMYRPQGADPKPRPADADLCIALAEHQRAMQIDVQASRLNLLLQVDTVLGPHELDVQHAIRNMIVSTDAWVGALDQLDDLALQDGRPPSSARIILIMSQSKHSGLELGLRELANIATAFTDASAFCYLVEFALNLVPDATALMKNFDAETLCSLALADARVDKILRQFPQLFGEDVAADAVTRVFDEGFVETEMLVEPASVDPELMGRTDADGDDDGPDDEPSGAKIIPFKKPE